MTVSYTMSSRVWFSEPYIRLTVEEEDAPFVGSYVEHGGRVCRIVRIDRPKDWFDSKVVLVLTNGPIEYGRVNPWESSQFMTLLRRLPKVVFSRGRWL